MHERVAAPVQPSHFAYADGLRLVAILVVVLNHLMLFARPSFGRALTFGYLGIWGVNCFFVLSGFLLTRSYLISLLDDRPEPSLRLFYLRRFLRIYPLYIVAVILSAVTATWLAGSAERFGDLGLQVVMFQGFSKTASMFPDRPLWTMGIDAGFYLVLPLIALALRPIVRGRPRAARLRIVCSSLVAIALASIVFRFCEYRANPIASYDFPTAVVYVRNLFGFACSFAIGTAVALMQIQKISLSKGQALVLAAIGFAIALFEFFGRFEGSAGNDLISLVKLSLLDPLAAVSSAMLFLAAAELRSKRLFGIVSSRFVATFAGLAYAIYLFHWLAIEVVERYVVHLRTGFGALGELMIGASILVVPFAWVVHRFVEEPFLRIKDSKRADAPETPAGSARAEVPAR